METSKVYVLPDSSGHITRIDGGYTTPVDLSGWVLIDEGHGDRYNLCQGNYFPLPILTEGGAYRYKLVDGKPVECTPEEIRAQEEGAASPPVPSLEERVETLETDTADMAEALSMILMGVTE